MKRTKKLTSTIIEQIAEKKDLRITNPSYNVYIVRAEGKRINRIQFNDESLPYCCGVSEFGNLSLERIPDKENKKLTEATKLLIQYAFLKATENNVEKNVTSSQKGVKICTPTIFCSNGRGACVPVEEAMSAMPLNFKRVSTSQNGEGGNIIKVYISKP